MQFVFALNEDWESTLALIGVFGVAFPALVTGLIAVAVIGAMGERADNQERSRRS